jgi:translocation and assembly module TamB
MEVSKVSLYLQDIPSVVIDNASGTILFDRSRATIQKLTAETGGGQITLTGFVEFGEVLVYRTQAQLRRFRMRYPTELPTTFDANLSLTGTSEASTLSGNVTLQRASLNVNADIGQLLSQSTQTEPAFQTSLDYLQGMQLDVRVQSGPGFQLETPLATDVEADVDLRLRGSPSRPVLLGSVTINRGQMQVFGSKYTVDRGDIRFINPVKIEPVFDMSLSTRARGITVSVAFTGTLQHLNINYSSDPPLQSSEIIALLAVGRDPTALSNQLGARLPGTSSNSGMQTGGSLLGQAATAQVNSKLQRFFGANRVKIDPTLTGIDNIPQARLTVEQQVSKDVTLTYITNLNRTQEQIIRVQWDLSRDWSAIAVRDPNGYFGIDFQFRHRF